MVVPLDQRPRSGPYSGLNFRSAKRFLARQFAAAGLPFADEDALDLLLGLSGLSQTDYALRGTEFISADLFEILQAAADRRLSGEPVDRILGWRDFYGRRFDIENVLSPRGDTEVLLLAAIKAVKPITVPHMLELGIGSGALSITLLCERPDAHVTATDINPEALVTARRNADTHQVSDRLTLIQSDWFEQIPPTPFDVILSNPPYIDDRAMSELGREVANYDPQLALHGGLDGLSPYRTIIPNARQFLKPKGWLGVEIGYDQGPAVRQIFERAAFTNIQVITDPAGHDRVVCGRLGQFETG
jgi:release factor glutamine methyltransferase